MILVFLILSFKLFFSLSSFTLIKRHFNTVVMRQFWARQSLAGPSCQVEMKVGQADDPLLSSLMRLLAGPRMFATWLLCRVSQPGSLLPREMEIRERWSRDRETETEKPKRCFCCIPSIRWKSVHPPTLREKKYKGVDELVGAGIPEVHWKGCLPQLLPVLLDYRNLCCLVATSCPTLCTSWTTAHWAPLSFTISRSLITFMSVELVMLCNHLILCLPLLLLPSIFPGIRVFSIESALHVSWPKYWSFSF